MQYKDCTISHCTMKLIFATSNQESPEDELTPKEEKELPSEEEEELAPGEDKELPPREEGEPIPEESSPEKEEDKGTQLGRLGCKQSWRKAGFRSLTIPMLVT